MSGFYRDIEIYSRNVQLHEPCIISSKYNLALWKYLWERVIVKYFPTDISCIILFQGEIKTTFSGWDIYKAV